MIWLALKSRLLSLLLRRAVAVPIIATPDLLPFTPTRPVRVVEEDRPLNLVSQDDPWRRIMFVPYVPGSTPSGRLDLEP